MKARHRMNMYNQDPKDEYKFLKGLLFGLFLILLLFWVIANPDRCNGDRQTMRLNDYYNIHKDKAVLVCGCGSSLHDLHLRSYEKVITIGVNAIGRIFTPDYLVFADDMQLQLLFAQTHPDYDNPHYILHSQAQSIFMYDHIYRHNLKYFPTEQINKIVEMPAQHIRNTQVYQRSHIYYSETSPMLALSLAIFMGAKTVGVVGFDFTGNYAWDNKYYNKSYFNSRFEQINSDLETLVRLSTQQHGIKFMNFSKISRFECIQKVEPCNIVEFYGYKEV